MFMLSPNYRKGSHSLEVAGRRFLRWVVTTVTYPRVVTTVTYPSNAYLRCYGSPSVGWRESPIPAGSSSSCALDGALQTDAGFHRVLQRKPFQQSGPVVQAVDACLQTVTQNLNTGVFCTFMEDALGS